MIRNAGNFQNLFNGASAFIPVASTIYSCWMVINNPNGVAPSYNIYMAGGAIGTTPVEMGIGNATTFSGAMRTPVNGSTISDFVFGPGGTFAAPGGGEALYDVWEASGVETDNPGGAPALSVPTISSQPQPLQLYAGATATFRVSASGGGLVYQWNTNGVPLVNGGNISGATSSTLIITNVSAANAASYICTVTNANTIGTQSVNSTAAALTIVSPNGTFESTLAAANPLHFYAFNETGNPSPGPVTAFDYAGGDNGIYGINTLNGNFPIDGPRPSPDGFPGFSTGNFAVHISFNDGDGNENVPVNSPWNLNTNTVTITAWINPDSSKTQNAFSTIAFNRGSGSDVGGFNYISNGITLGYTWNNDSGTTSWDSGLTPPAGQWSFVALVVTPTNATISMMNANGLISSTHVYAHANEAFGGTTMIGDDSGTPSGSRGFQGSIDEVSVFNKALSTSQLQSIFTNASDVAIYAPTTNSVILVTPANGTNTAGLSAQFSSQTESGSQPLSYTWRINNANLTNGTNGVGLVFGSTNSLLTISNLVAGVYNATLITSNSAGSITSSVPAHLVVNSPNGPINIFAVGQQAGGLDWNSPSNWSDNLSAQDSQSVYPGSTNIIGVYTNIGVNTNGTLIRTPGITNAVFPGSGPLQIQGNGVLIDGNSAIFPTNTTTGALRLKQPGIGGLAGYTTVTNFGIIYADGGTIYFPDLQLLGGQVDNATSSKITLLGRMDVLSNSFVYVDSGANGGIRPIQINSFLTGTATLTYGYLSTGATNDDLIISGITNTFSGQWNIIGGTLLGTAANSLGTNTITIGTNSALETTYNINNPKGNLILNGQMFLYTSNTFNAAVIGGYGLPAGTYTSAQLNSAYPSNFPTIWPVQVGSSTGTNTGVGYITVLSSLGPLITQQPTNLTLNTGQNAQFTAIVSNVLGYQWWFSTNSSLGTALTDGGQISGSLSSVLTISTVTTNNAGTYTLVVTNAAASTISLPATLTIGTSSSSTNTTLIVLHSGSSLVLSWTNNANSTLQTATNLPGPWTTILGATSPYTNNITPTNARTQFYRVHP